MRRLLVIAALFIAGFTYVNAADVRLQFDGVRQWDGVTGAGNSFHGGAGLFTWNHVSNLSSVGTAVFGPTGDKAYSFCIEIGENISSGSSYDYTITSNLASLPQSSVPGGMGPVRAAALQKLAAYIGANPSQFVMGGMYDAPEVQAAIWNIVFEANVADIWNGTGGSFAIANPGGTLVAANVNALLTAVSTFSTTNPLKYFLGITNSSNQDQIVLVNPEQYQEGGGNIVPVPAGVVLSGIGIFCLTGVNFLRRRKTIMTA